MTQKPASPPGEVADKVSQKPQVLGADDPAIAEPVARYIKSLREPSSGTIIVNILRSHKQKLHGFLLLSKAQYPALGVSVLTPKVDSLGIITSLDVGQGLTPVIIYLRVSSRDQRDLSASLEDQLTEILEALAKLGNCVVVGVFWDDDSGTHYDRPGFQAAKDFARTHAAQALAVWAVNRYGRDAVDGLVEGREFSRSGCPVWYKRSGNSTRFRVANHLEPEDFGDFASDLFDAEADYREHQNKTRRGQRGILLRGGWPYGQFPASVLYTICEEGARGDRLRRVVLLPDASEVLASVLAFLDDHATLAALAETLDTTPKVLLRDLQSRRLIGILDSQALELEDNIHPKLQLVSRSVYQALQARIEVLPVATPTTAPVPRRSRIAEVLDSTSPTELFEVSRGRMGIVCKCGKLAKPVEGFEYADRDVWQCPDGHKNRTLPDAVRHGLAFGDKSACLTCGCYEFWEDLGQKTIDGKLCRHLKCRKCGTESYCTHEVEAVRKRVLRIRNRGRPDPTRVAPDPPKLLAPEPVPAPAPDPTMVQAPTPAPSNETLPPLCAPRELPEIPQRGTLRALLATTGSRAWPDCPECEGTSTPLPAADGLYRCLHCNNVFRD